MARLPCVVLRLALGLAAVPVAASAQESVLPQGSLGTYTPHGLFGARSEASPFAKLFREDSDLRHLRFSSGADLQTAQKPSKPARTGLKALVFETGSDFNAYPRRRSTWVILAIGGGAAALAHPFDDEVNGKLVGSDAVGKFFAPGKYIGAVYTQAGVAVGLYVIGRYLLPHTEGAPRTNKVSHIGFDMLRAIIVSQALTHGIKEVVRRDRPDGECCAFPSGHASATFATASVLERHLGYRGSWHTFLIATYVAMSRLHDNRHFLSDVMFGAAVGVSTGWTVVGRHGRSTFTLMPVPVRGGIGVALTTPLRGRTVAGSDFGPFSQTSHAMLTKR